MLNAKTGFKSLNNGDDIVKYQSEIAINTLRDEKGFISYYYNSKNKDLYNVFNQEMAEIILTFNRMIN